MTKQTAVFEPLTDRVDRLARELKLAIRWDRPSILLAVYSSMYVMNDAAAALEAQLREGGQQVAWVRVGGEADADIPSRLAEHPQRNGTIFFVSGLQWGGKTALRALNIRREYFVDQRLQAVFWLTESEAVDIAREAPDFWAFRHRVVEFVEVPEPGRAAEMAHGLAWWGLEERTLREDAEAKVALREALLADLPEGDETLAARAELQYTLGGLYWANRQYERAEESFRAALEGAQRTDNTRLEAWCHNSLGNVYSDLDWHEEAIAHYQRALEIGALPDKGAKVHHGLGNVYHDLGRYKEAIAEYRQAIELDPQYVHPHNDLGNVYRDLGRYEEAVAEFQYAIELDPQYAGPHHGLGHIYQDQGQMDLAIAEFQKAIELERNDGSHHNCLGNVYADLSRHEEAIAEYQNAIDLDPKDALPHHGLGTVYVDLGRHEEAVVEFQRAIELDPQYAYPHRDLGTLYASLGRHEEAVAEYQRAIELDSQYATPHHGLGTVYRALGRYEEAVAEYQRAIELNPRNAVFQASFAAACRKLGHEAEYAEHIRLARELMANESDYNKACIEAIAGNTDEALEWLARALEKAPEMRDLAQRDPDFDLIRDDPRFQELVAEGSDTGAQEEEG
ncbi:MAG: tetratricopeptide repeat protein [Anaerolineales bacterium]|nr:MAG: tetratricopeptide repeat protein [Anaerolineales bacterium]